MMKNFAKKLVKIIKKKEIIPVLVPKEKSDLLLNKVAFVSGGSGGIGFAIAEQLLKCGCKVILGGTKEEKLAKCKDNLKKKNDHYIIETIVFDNNDINELSTKVKSIVNIFGQLDIFINAAGVHTEKLDFWNIAPKEFDRIMNINLKGPYFACLEIAKYMKENNIKGHMLLISSSRGSEPAWSPYSISKKCIDSLIRGLAKQFASSNITVVGIAPGPTATPLIGFNEGDSIYTEETALKRMALPEEISNFIPLLVSDTGDMLTGEVIHISGGRGVFDIR